MWLSIAKVPSEGISLEFNDPTIWSIPIKEFKLDCRVTKPLSAIASITPQMGEGIKGCLISGHFTGEIAMPCIRCAEDAIIPINSDFESFEPFPNTEEASNLNEIDFDENVVRLVASGYEVNIEELLWQEFSLIIPLKPLCSPNCKGLCPVCGANKNLVDCGCTIEESDSRLAILRSLKISH